MTTDWVQVRLGGERYAIDVADTLEVGLRGDVTRVPGAPCDVLGVHNLRGQILPVLDLAGALGVADGDGTQAPYIVVAEGDGHRASLAVDEILAVGTLAGAPEPLDDAVVTGRLVAGGELFGIVDVRALLASVSARRA